MVDQIAHLLVSLLVSGGFHRNANFTSRINHEHLQQCATEKSIQNEALLENLLLKNYVYACLCLQLDRAENTGNGIVEGTFTLPRGVPAS